MKVRFVHAAVALTYDAKHDRVVKLAILLDSRGRQWESYDGGDHLLVASPDEPNRNQLNVKKRTKK